MAFPRRAAREQTYSRRIPDLLRNCCQKGAGITLEPKYECSQAQTLIAMAHAELGAAILPQSILGTRQAQHVQALRITSPSLRREIGPITLKDKPLLPAATRLTELARSHFLKKPSSQETSGRRTRS